LWSNLALSIIEVPPIVLFRLKNIASNYIKGGTSIPLLSSPKQGPGANNSQHVNTKIQKLLLCNMI
ncbi:hypothetical protein J7M28_11690, partial [bacterium]|nr:hypothetical protein [bacterium]